MKTEEDFRELEIHIKRLERENRALHATLLDQFAQAALASGRASPQECYSWAQQALQERKNYVRP